MKPVGLISMVVLLGTVGPTSYAQQPPPPPPQQQQPEDKQHKQEQKPKPEKEPEAKPQKQEEGQAKDQQEQEKKQKQEKKQQQEAKSQKQEQPQENGQQKQQQANRPPQQEQHGQRVEQQAAWQGHRAHDWKSEHRDWQQRGGYNGYRISEDLYRSYFGPSHAFRMYSYPVVVVGGYPRFQYNGFWFSVVDPWPEYWSDDWYDNDDLYIEYYGGGYYLYNRRYPQDRVAVIVSVPA
jgi:flagellar motor protein MotB